MIFGQGSMRCHPYLYEELQLLQAEDPKAALNPFDTMLFKHLGYTFNRTARSFAYAFSGVQVLRHKVRLILPVLITRLSTGSVPTLP